MTHDSPPQRPPLDKDLFFASGGDLYQVLTSIHPQNRVIALRKYFFSADKPDGMFFWHSPQRPGYFTRGIPSYNVENATKNISDSKYSRLSHILGVPMIEVPWDEIERYMYPEAGLQQFLNSGEENEWTRAVTGVLAEFETYLGIESTSLGLTGSLLWGAQHASSDIDLIIYGIAEARTFIEGIEDLLSQSTSVTLPPSEFVARYASTLAGKTGLSVDLCAQYIARKKYYLFYEDRFLSLGFVPLPYEITRQYETYSFHALAPVRITARIIDNQLGYFYPAEYKIEVLDADLGDNNAVMPEVGELIPQITTLLTMEREISGYYYPGDEVEVSGLLEEVQDGSDRYYQVLLGTREMFGHEYVKLLR